jgi:hypothetical protein
MSDPTRLVADVIVYSGTPGGIATAIAAARGGVSVVLIEPTMHVGGMNTSGLNTAETEHMLKWTIGGIADEFYRRLGRYYEIDGPEYYFESSVAENTFVSMLKDAGVLVHFGSHLTKVVKINNVIKEVVLSNGVCFSGRCFVDASYEGDLLAQAGVEFTVGRESREEYNEEAAGIRFDRVPRQARTIGRGGKLKAGISGWVRDYTEGDSHSEPMCYNFRPTVATDPDLLVPIPEPSSYDASRYELLGDFFGSYPSGAEVLTLRHLFGFPRRRNGKFELNNKQDAIVSLGHFGGQFGWAGASHSKRQRMFADHWDYTLGLLYFLKNEPCVPAPLQAEVQTLGLHCGEFKDNGHLPYQLYIREARRMRGKFVVTQKDTVEERRKEDTIGISSHFLDSHHVQRLAVSENTFVNEGRIWRMGYAFQIPYASLLPKKSDCENLLVPVAASFSHVAFCALRLESVWMITGHAAGAAAAMAVKSHLTPHEVEIKELQEALRRVGQVLDFPPGEPEKCLLLNGPPEV